MVGGVGRDVLEYPPLMLVLGFNKLDRLPDEWLDALGGEKPQLVVPACSAYEYCEEGDGSIIVSRGAVWYVTGLKDAEDGVSSDGVMGCDTWDECEYKLWADIGGSDGTVNGGSAPRA